MIVVGILHGQTFKKGVLNCFLHEESEYAIKNNFHLGNLEIGAIRGQMLGSWDDCGGDHAWAVRNRFMVAR
jgi:hypothetical protein